MEVHLLQKIYFLESEHLYNRPISSPMEYMSHDPFLKI